MIFLLYLCFFDLPSFLHHAIMVGALAMLLGLVFYLLVLYNYPFDEPSAVSAEAFRKLLDYWKIDVLPSAK